MRRVFVILLVIGAALGIGVAAQVLDPPMPTVGEGVIWSTDTPVPLAIVRHIDTETGQPFYVQQGPVVCVPALP